MAKQSRTSDQIFRRQERGLEPCPYAKRMNKVFLAAAEGMGVRKDVEEWFMSTTVAKVRLDEGERRGGS